MTCALKHVGGTVLRYQHEDAWAEVMFNEWGADGLKVDHMCQGVNCGTGQQGHMMAVEYACVQCYPPLLLHCGSPARRAATERRQCLAASSRRGVFFLSLLLLLLLLVLLISIARVCTRTWATRMDDVIACLDCTGTSSQPWSGGRLRSARLAKQTRRCFRTAG